MHHDTLLPRAPGGNAPGALLALVAHAGLVLALTVSVDWRSQPADVVAAELWASVPQLAAPPPPLSTETRAEPQAEPRTEKAALPAPPAPAARAETRPSEPDIAIERAERRKAEADTKKRAEVERLRVEADRKQADANKRKRDDDAREARETVAQDKRLAEQREANLRRMMGDAAGVANGRSGATAGTAAQDAAPSAAYAGRVAALIRRSSVFTGSVPGNPAAEVEVRAAASGSIIARRIVKSSGHKAWDEAVLQAIDKAGTLPRDSDGRVPSQIIVAFRPKDE